MTLGTWGSGTAWSAWTSILPDVLLPSLAVNRRWNSCRSSLITQLDLARCVIGLQLKFGMSHRQVEQTYHADWVDGTGMRFSAQMGLQCKQSPIAVLV